MLESMWRKENPLVGWWKCKLIQPLWRPVWKLLKKTRNKTTIWPNNLTTGHIPWGNHNWKRHMYPNVCCSTIYTAMTWKQPRCPLTDKWIKKLWHIYTLEYYSAIKRYTFESLLMMWMNLEPVTESEVSQEGKNKYCILMHLCVI